MKGGGDGGLGGGGGTGSGPCGEGHTVDAFSSIKVLFL